MEYYIFWTLPRQVHRRLGNAGVHLAHLDVAAEVAKSHNKSHFPGYGPDTGFGLSTSCLLIFDLATGVRFPYGLRGILSLGTAESCRWAAPFRPEIAPTRIPAGYDAFATVGRSPDYSSGGRPQCWHAHGCRIYRKFSLARQNRRLPCRHALFGS